MLPAETAHRNYMHSNFIIRTRVERPCVQSVRQLLSRLIDAIANPDGQGCDNRILDRIE